MLNVVVPSMITYKDNYQLAEKSFFFVDEMWVGQFVFDEMTYLQLTHSLTNVACLGLVWLMTPWHGINC